MWIWEFVVTFMLPLKILTYMEIFSLNQVIYLGQREVLSLNRIYENMLNLKNNKLIFIIFDFKMIIVIPCLHI
jgi:hypothetical protein